MSMLAEPKRKVKWSNNPCGNSWAHDASKYGQKMLEKMGWRKGKGLGKFEHGNVDHVKVVFKKGNSGVGWDVSKAQEFVPFQGDFDSLLKNLKEGSHCAPPPNMIKEQVSLESKSKCSRKRVHYQKFIRGKDVSQYSVEDKQSVLGKKTENDVEVSNSYGFGNADSRNGNSESSFGVETFTSANSVADYFANLAKRRKLSKDEHEDPKGLEDISTELPQVSEEEVYSQNLLISDIKQLAKANAKAERRQRKNKNKKKNKKKSKEAISNSNRESTVEHDDQNSLVKNKSEGIVSEEEIRESIESDEVNSDGNTHECVEDRPKVLRSCMKSEISLKSVKSVTFNDKVSYDFIPTRAEIQLMESTETDEDFQAASVDEQVEIHTSDSESETSVSSVTSDEKDSSASEPSSDSPNTNSSNKGVSIQAYMTLPVFKTNGSSSDSWSVTLKLAEKMSHYNSVMEKISQHEILSTTNLFEIKGYGS